MTERFGKTHPWVPDGIYDHHKYLVRYKIKEGRAQEVASLLWIQSDKAVELSEDMRVQWGTYPNLPDKPKVT